ncbi:MAG: amidophosphoribosyltransferase [Bacillota bacterium]
MEDLRSILPEECGVIGGTFADNAAGNIFLGLQALQHRGQESAGITTFSKNEYHIKKGMGLVNNIFGPEDLNQLPGSKAIGHVRYSTSGASKAVNSQPLLVKCKQGQLALAHNGNLINQETLKNNLEAQGSIFHSELDTEIIAHLIARSLESSMEEALIQALQQIQGAFSLVALAEGRILAARDPHGFRPLSIGRLHGNYIIASETAAFNLLGAELVRDVRPGELVIINGDKLESRMYTASKPENFCSFEFIYFARPDSIISGQSVQMAREEMGKILAQEMNIEGDIVVPVPDSGIGAAIGLSRETGIPYSRAILRNRYVGRTFINPAQDKRNLKVRIKLSPIQELLAGKKIILVDDSIVRGTTGKQVVRMVKEAGAEEVHFVVSSPPVAHPCYFGLDTSRRKELIANENSPAEIADFLGVDSLTYLSQEGLLRAVSTAETDFCTACFDGSYPQMNGVGYDGL